MKIQLRHILVQHKYEAEDILKKLQEAIKKTFAQKSNSSPIETFSLLAKKYSTCPSAQLGGDLGLIDIKRLDADFAEAAQILKPLEISSIVRTKFGYHLIMRDE